MSEETGTVMVIAAVVVLIGASATGMLWGCPQYNVYSQEMSGKAKLAEAQSSRQVAILEARAKMESAQSLAKAEVARAKGAAEANHILQNSLGGPEGYLRYLQIQALQDTNARLIYVPTESGLPVTESTRLMPRPQP
jgi:predicted aminopeptidase